MNGMPAKKLNADTVEKKTKKVRGAKKGKQKIKLIKGGRKSKKDKLSEEARQELVLEFRLKARKLGRSILRKWHARMDLQEVDSIVDLSLCEAVRSYDPTKGASFMTFLYYHLKGNLIRAISAAATANCIPQTEAENDAKGEEKTATSKAVNAIDVAEALCNHDHILPDEVLLKKQLIDLSHAACSRLDSLEREVIYRIYLKGQQLLDIANSLGYSRCHISRVKKRALELLNTDVNKSLEMEAESIDNDKVAHLFKSDSESERRKVHRRRPRSKKALEAQQELEAVNY